MDKREDENCDFEEFLSAVRTIFLYDSFFEEMLSIFHHIDNTKSGKVKVSDLIEGINKLRSSEVMSLHELRVPESKDVEAVYKKLNNSGAIEVNGMLS